MSQIRLRNGRQFDFSCPESTPLSIDDIAWGLSREFRYSNQSEVCLSVAEHSVLSSRMPFVPNEFRLGILLHDASECVMRDIASPLKDLLPDYRMMEYRVQSSIYQSFGIAAPPLELIHQVDDVMREHEMSYVFDSMRPYEPWGQMESYMKFLEAFEQVKARYIAA